MKDPGRLNADIYFIEEGNFVRVSTATGSVALTFQKEDFEYYSSEHNLKNILRIERCDFVCQKDEYFSDYVWTIYPIDVDLRHPMDISIQYTQEEFAPQFNLENLTMYKLKRDYRAPGDDDSDQRLFRVGDMILLDQCAHDVNNMMVSAEVSNLGGYVLDRRIK